MADSIREKILNNIKESLEVIRISNGYETDITNIQRWDSEFNPMRDTPLVCIVPDEEEKTDENTWPEMSCRLSVILEFWFRHDKTIFNCNTDEILSGFLADIERAVMQDPTRGGNAVTTHLRGNTPFELVEGAAYSGFVIRIEILYKHTHNDPYN